MQTGARPGNYTIGSLQSRSFSAFGPFRIPGGLRHMQRFVGELLRLGPQRTQRRLTRLLHL
jgi:hypothetical protein